MRKLQASREKLFVPLFSFMRGVVAAIAPLPVRWGKRSAPLAYYYLQGKNKPVSPAVQNGDLQKKVPP